MTTRAIGYVRVSSEDQVREGVSLDAQETRIRAFATAEGWTLVDIVRDEGRSAKDMNRPGLQRILGQATKRSRGFDVLMVVKLDRLTRSVRDLGVLMDTFRRGRLGFTSLEESVDTTSAAGELFLNVIGALSQWERRAIGERIRSAMAHLRRTGRRYSGEPPYGWRFGPDDRLVADADAAPPVPLTRPLGSGYKLVLPPRPLEAAPLAATPGGCFHFGG